MRKKVVYGWLLAALFSLTPIMAMADGIWKNRLLKMAKDLVTVAVASNDLPSDAQTKTVYLIVGTDAVVPKSAHYSPSENRIYIKEGTHMMNYNVHENPQYGQDSAMGKFKYRASNYFFDL